MSKSIKIAKENEFKYIIENYRGIRRKNWQSLPG